MATGEGENGNHSQLSYLSYGSCDWGTGRATVCPPGPEATRTLSPSVALQRVYVEDDVEIAVAATCTSRRTRASNSACGP